ncbi:rhamnan synthesis F family protein [Bifidobacterium aemilianum]|nr:rhamnan synthesis F family protein [Bifidobacterium aemilianum]
MSEIKVVYKEHERLRSIERQLGELVNRRTIRRNSKARILVLLHLYYAEAWPEIREYLLNLRPYDVDLVATVTEGRVTDETIADIASFNGRTNTVITVPNKGFDLGPFFEAARGINKDYDLVFKLHSKGTKRPFQYIYNQCFFRRSWFLNLYDGILSPRRVHNIVEAFMGERRISLAAADNLIIKDPLEKQALHRSIANSMGLSLKADYKYVAGTCFALSMEQFTAIKKLGYSIDDFEPTSATSVEDLAHFLERYICTVNPGNVHMLGTRTATIHRALCTPLCAILKVTAPFLKGVRAQLRAGHRLDHSSSV